MCELTDQRRLPPCQLITKHRGTDTDTTSLRRARLRTVTEHGVSCSLGAAVRMRAPPDSSRRRAARRKDSVRNITETTSPPKSYHFTGSGVVPLFPSVSFRSRGTFITPDTAAAAAFHCSSEKIFSRKYTRSRSNWNNLSLFLSS